MIPRVLHHVWLGPHRIPSEFLEWRETWFRLHPGWRYRLWTDADVPATALPLVKATRTLASAANVLRIHAILTEGGVYADLDFEWNQPIDPLLDARAFVGRSKKGPIYNGAFGAVANHPILRWQWERMPEFAPLKPPWGPRLMGLAIDALPDGVVVHPPRVFYPLDWDEEPLPVSAFPDSVAVHRAAMSWKKPS